MLVLWRGNIALRMTVLAVAGHTEGLPPYFPVGYGETLSVHLHAWQLNQRANFFFRLTV